MKIFNRNDQENIFLSYSITTTVENGCLQVHLYNEVLLSCKKIDIIKYADKWMQ